MLVISHKVTMWYCAALTPPPQLRNGSVETGYQEQRSSWWSGHNHAPSGIVLSRGVRQ